MHIHGTMMFKHIHDYGWATLYIDIYICVIDDGVKYLQKTTYWIVAAK